MDTDDLSQEAYKAIIIEAEKFNHDLTLRFGLLSQDCDDEEEYLDKFLAPRQFVPHDARFQLGQGRRRDSFLAKVPGPYPVLASGNAH